MRRNSLAARRSTGRQYTSTDVLPSRQGGRQQWHACSSRYPRLLLDHVGRVGRVDARGIRWSRTRIATRSHVSGDNSGAESSIELPHPPRTRARLGSTTLTGDLLTYDACRREAPRIRARGGKGLATPSARDERVFVLFGRRPDLVGWAARHEGRPRDDLLPRVRHLR